MTKRTRGTFENPIVLSDDESTATPPTIVVAPEDYVSFDEDIDIDEEDIVDYFDPEEQEIEFDSDAEDEFNQEVQRHLRNVRNLVNLHELRQPSRDSHNHPPE